MFDSVLKKVLSCAVIGFVLGLFLGVIYGVQLSEVWMPFITPFAGALYVIGIVFGSELIKKGFGSLTKLLGSTARIGSYFMRSLWGILIGVLVILFIGIYVIGFFLAVCWIPGVFIAGKALLDERKGYSTSRHDDGWGDENFMSTPKPPKMKPRRESPRIPDDKSDGDDWNW